MIPRRQCAFWGITLLRQLHLGTVVHGWIPPHPEFANPEEEWEPVHIMRRRLGLEYNYSPNVLAAEMCRYVSEEDCEDADQSMKVHIASQRSIQKQRRKNPNLGKIKVLVLMIRFSDHQDREMIPKDAVDTFWKTKVPDWLDVNSQGRYSIDPVVIDWQTTDKSEKYYSMGMRGIVPELQKMAWPILDELDSRPNWDWTQFDIDGNGQLDSVVMIHSGYGAETTTPDCYDREYTDRIWAHAYSSSRNSWKSKDNSMRLNAYTVASAFHGDCGTQAGKIGLTVHEFMHTLGLEDLYDGVDPIAAAGIGAFDIMAYPYGQNDDADTPGHLSVFSKILAEWANPTVISQPGDFTLKASEISDDAYRINLSEEDEEKEEYLLIENRQPLEFDINIWSSGLIIYHIDDAAKLQKNLGYPGQPGWPENGNHYQVALLPKDGLYELEKGKNVGDAGDFWEPGDVLGPGMGGSIYPNTDRYQGGKIMETGLTLEVLRQEGTDVTFRLQELDGQQQLITTEPPTPVPSSLRPGVPTIPSPIYLHQFGMYDGRPADAEYLSEFGNYPPPASYLTGFDSSKNLQKDEPDAKGFISMAIEKLTNLGVATTSRGDNARPKESNYANSKKEKDVGRSPEEDRTMLGGRGKVVFSAVGETHRSVSSSALPASRNQAQSLTFSLLFSWIVNLSIL